MKYLAHVSSRVERAAAIEEDVTAQYARLPSQHVHFHLAACCAESAVRQRLRPGHDLCTRWLACKDGQLWIPCRCDRGVMKDLSK